MGREQDHLGHRDLQKLRSSEFIETSKMKTFRNKNPQKPGSLKIKFVTIVRNGDHQQSLSKVLRKVVGLKVQRIKKEMNRGQRIFC